MSDIARNGRLDRTRHVAATLAALLCVAACSAESEPVAQSEPSPRVEPSPSPAAGDAGEPSGPTPTATAPAGVTPEPTDPPSVTATPTATPTPTPTVDEGPEIGDVGPLRAQPPVWLAELRVGENPTALFTMDPGGTGASSAGSIADGGLRFPFDISPDGTTIAHGVTDAPGVIVLRATDGSVRGELLATSGVNALAWSPQGDRLAYIGCRSSTDCGVSVIEIATGVVVDFLLDDYEPDSLRPDIRWGGEALFVARLDDPDDPGSSARLVRVPLDGSQPTIYSETELYVEGGFDVTSDGAIAVLAVPARPIADLVLLDLSDGSMRPIDEGPNGTRPHFSPDESVIAYEGSFDFTRRTSVWLVSVEGDAALELDRLGRNEIVAWPQVPGDG